MDQLRRADVGGVVIGLIILGVGVYYLLDNTFGFTMPELDWDKIWPLAIIVLGLATWGCLSPVASRRAQPVGPGVLRRRGSAPIIGTSGLTSGPKNLITSRSSRPMLRTSTPRTARSCVTSNSSRSGAPPSISIPPYVPLPDQTRTLCTPRSVLTYEPRGGRRASSR